jgi:hypothetical protein
MVDENTERYIERRKYTETKNNECFIVIVCKGYHHYHQSITIVVVTIKSALEGGGGGLPGCNPPKPPKIEI